MNPELERNVVWLPRREVLALMGEDLIVDGSDGEPTTWPRVMPALTQEVCR